jgi:GDP-L-fucose synthase
MRTYIAGHLGLVGSALMRNSPNPDLVVTARRDELNIVNEEDVYKFLVKNNVSRVILAAAKVGGIGANSAKPRIFLYENLLIQNSVMMAALRANISSLAFLGSSCIYPKFAEQPIREESLLRGELEPTNEAYALAKIAGIKLASYIHQESNQNFFSLMPSNLYGPNDNFDLITSHVPAALLRKFHEAKQNGHAEVTVWGTGTPLREFMHVDDLARACWLMLDKEVGGEIINIGTGSEISISSFAEMIASVVGFQGEILYDRTKPDGTPRKLLSVAKAHSLGWNHQVELEDGMKSTYSWFKSALVKGGVRGYN